MISWGVLFFSFLLSPFSFLFLGGRFFSLFSSFVSCHFLASEVFGCFEWLSIFVIPNSFHRYATFYSINSQAVRPITILSHPGRSSGTNLSSKNNI
jgi:hypothetical protein